MANVEILNVSDKDGMNKRHIVELFYPDQVKAIEDSEDNKLRAMLGDDVANLTEKADEENLAFVRILEDEEFREIEKRLGAGNLMVAIMTHSSRFSDLANKLGVFCSEEDRIDTVNKLIKRIKTSSGSTETTVIETLLGTLFSDLKDTRVKKQKELFYEMKINPAVLKDKIEKEVLDGDSIKIIEGDGGDMFESVDYSWAKKAKRSIDALYPNDVSGLSESINKVVGLTVVSEYDRVKNNPVAAFASLEEIFEKKWKKEILLDKKLTEKFLVEAISVICNILEKTSTDINQVEKIQLKIRFVDITCWLMKFDGDSLPLPTEIIDRVDSISKKIDDLFVRGSIPRSPSWYGKEIKLEDITFALESFGVYKNPYK